MRIADEADKVAKKLERAQRKGGPRAVGKVMFDIGKDLFLRRERCSLVRMPVSVLRVDRVSLMLRS